MPNLKGKDIYFKGQWIRWRETLVERVVKRIDHKIILEGDENFIKKHSKEIKEQIKLYYL